MIMGIDIMGHELEESRDRGSTVISDYKNLLIGGMGRIARGCIKPAILGASCCTGEMEGN